MSQKANQCSLPLLSVPPNNCYSIKTLLNSVVSKPPTNGSNIAVRMKYKKKKSSNTLHSTYPVWHYLPKKAASSKPMVGKPAESPHTEAGKNFHQEIIPPQSQQSESKFIPIQPDCTAPITQSIPNTSTPSITFNCPKANVAESILQTISSSEADNNLDPTNLWSPSPRLPYRRSSHPFDKACFKSDLTRLTGFTSLPPSTVRKHTPPHYAPQYCPDRVRLDSYLFD